MARKPKAAAAKPPRRRKSPAKHRPTLTVRHYCQGIGDSHLLRFTSKPGKDFWMLIDCGVHVSVSGGAKTIGAIVEDIASVTKRIDVLVVTHEHWDHVSGFLTEAERFKTLDVRQVWMGWTEDPNDPQAKDLDKFKQQALAALSMASQRLDDAPDASPFMLAVRQGLKPVLGFNFGAKGEKVRSARDAAAELGKNDVRYLEPGNRPLTLDQLPGLRIYVLGPPRDAKLLRITERASEMFGLGVGSGWPLARSLAGAFRLADDQCPPDTDYAAPFEPNIGMALDLVKGAARDQGSEAPTPELRTLARRHYFGPADDPCAAGLKNGGKIDPADLEQAWRRIDGDWLGVSAELAMQLDDRTNNTSLVLAFEDIDSGRVFLFAADAQVGNWLSWQDLKWRVGDKEVTGPELLSRVVYLKVSHHGSENATLKEKGLDLMVDRDLSAFIPTNEKDAKKVKWRHMPFGKIMNALNQKCSKRVIRADDAWLASPNMEPGFPVPSGSILAVRHENGLWVELDLR